MKKLSPFRKTYQKVITMTDDHTSRLGGILLQVGPSLIDIDGEYRGGGVVEEVEENEGGNASDN